MPVKPHKLVQIRTTVGTDVDIQKLIGQVHTYAAKSKMKDRIEIHINGVHTPTQEVPVEGAELL